MTKRVRPSRRGAVLAGVLVCVCLAGAVGVAVSAQPPAAHSGARDAGVWVSNESEQAAGRVNTQIDELATVVPAPSTDTEVVQNGSTIVFVDNTTGTATRIDPATARPAGSLALPGRQSRLLIAGEDAVVVARDGRLWQAPVADFSGIDTGRDHDLALGAGAVVAATPSGGILAVSPTTGEVLRSEPGTRLADAAREPLTLPARGIRLQAVATTTGWAVLDAAGAALATPRGTVDLADALGGDGHGAVLQQSAPGSSVDRERNESVFIATRTGLLEVELETGRITARVAGRDAEPVRPVVVDGCAYAAWSGGESWRRCTADPAAGSTGGLAEMSPLARPVFRTNATEVVLNDPASGQVWAVRSDNRLIADWGDLDRADAVPVSIADDDAAQPQPAPQREARPGRPSRPAPTRPPSPPIAGAAQPSSVQPSAPRTPPTATPVSARIDADSGTVALAWSPFATADDPVLGYFAQSLGANANATAAATACAVPSPGTVRAPTGGEVVDVQRWTTASFDGIDQTGADYGFVVWGYNGAGCTASAMVTVTLHAPPGPLTAVRGSMVEVGNALEYRIDALQPQAARYEVQRMQADGGPAGDPVDLAGAPVIPRLVTGGPFGEAYAYRIRACNSAEHGAACGEWSAQAAPEASLNFEVAGLAYSSTSGAWTWTSLPENGALKPRVNCGSHSGAHGHTTMLGPSCEFQATVPDADAWLRITVGSRSVTFPR